MKKLYCSFKCNLIRITFYFHNMLCIIVHFSYICTSLTVLLACRRNICYTMLKQMRRIDGKFWIFLWGSFKEIIFLRFFSFIDNSSDHYHITTALGEVQYQLPHVEGLVALILQLSLNIFPLIH